MQWFRTIFREIFGLFVDDGSFGIAILVWLGIMWLVLPRLRVYSPWSGLILFAGLGAILVQSAARYAIKSGQTSKDEKHL